MVEILKISEFIHLNFEVGEISKDKAKRARNCEGIVTYVEHFETML